jgi:hypothetical protein
LGYSDTRSFAEAIGLHERTIGRLETGHSVGRNTLVKIETFFGWEPQSAEAILAGGDPQEVGAAAAGTSMSEDDPGDLAPLDDVEQKIWDIKPLGDARRTHILFYRASVKHEKPYGQTG